MENSSQLPASAESPIPFPPNAFRVGPTILTALGAIVLLFVAMFAGVIVYFIEHGFDVAGLQRASLGMFGIGLQSIAELIVVGFFLLVMPAVAHSTLRDLGFRAPQAQNVLKIVGGIVAMFVLVTVLGTLLSSVLHFKSQELAIEIFMRMQGWQKLLFAVFAILVGPLFEECAFRLFLFNAMRKWWGFWPGAVISSILFGLAHAQPPFSPVMFAALSIPLAVGGMVLCWVYARTGSFWGNFTTHATFNALSMLLVVLAPQLAK